VGVTQGDTLGEEAATVEAAQAQNEGFIPSEMRHDKVSIQEIETHETKNIE